MRVSSSQFHMTVNASLQNSNAELEKLMGQMASGNRLTRPSDDPVSHVRIARLQREEASIDQYLSNIDALNSRLSYSETVMTGMDNDLLSARDLLVWALDGTNTTADLQSMATSMEALRDSLMASSLTKDQEGNYLFSGTATRTPTVVRQDVLSADGQPVLGTDGKPLQAYVAGGNRGQQMVVVGNGITQPANVALGDETAAVLNALQKAITAIRQDGANANQPQTRDALTQALTAVDVAKDSMGVEVSRIGGAQNIMATLESNLNNLSTANQTATLEYGQLDYAEASTRLYALTAAIQATQGAYGKVSQLSLFNVL